MRQCPPFILTFSSPDIFNTELVDSNSYAHYVVRTPSTAHSGIRSSPIRLPSSPNTAKIRPTLQRWGFARNPTIVVRPKSSSSEAKIVASLQWHHWSDSIFSTRWQVVRLEKILPLKDEEDRPFIPNASREFPTTKGLWRWRPTSAGGFQLLDASDKPVACFEERGSLPTSSETLAGLPQLHIEFKALDLLDLVVCSLLVVVHEREQYERSFPLRDSAESIEIDDVAPTADSKTRTCAGD